MLNESWQRSDAGPHPLNRGVPGSSATPRLTRLREPDRRKPWSVPYRTELADGEGVGALDGGAARLTVEGRPRPGGRGAEAGRGGPGPSGGRPWFLAPPLLRFPQQNALRMATR